MNSKLYKFMIGRYGIDELYRFLFIIYFILVIIDFFIDFYPLTIVTFLLLIFILYRVLSKNIRKRQKENQVYLKVRNNIRIYFYDLKKKYNNRKNNIYKRCPKCRTMLRLNLPDKRGINHVVCPKCKKRITMFVLRKQKVEVIVYKKKK